MIETVLAFLSIAGQERDAAAVARELMEIEQRLATCWQNGDCQAWGALVAEEWSVIHFRGSVITKSQAMEMCETPPAPIEALTVDELSVRSFGEAAVVTGRTRATSGGPNADTITLRFTDVFVRRGGRWQVVASQATRLVPD
jgi:hypothetical protein